MNDLMADLLHVVDLDNDPCVTPEYRDGAAMRFLRTHHAELEAMARDAATLRRIKALRDTWERDEREHLATFGQHLPASVICLVEKLDAAMHNSAREG